MTYSVGSYGGLLRRFKIIGCGGGPYTSARLLMDMLSLPRLWGTRDAGETSQSPTRRSSLGLHYGRLFPSVSQERSSLALSNKAKLSLSCSTLRERRVTDSILLPALVRGANSFLCSGNVRREFLCRPRTRQRTPCRSSCSTALPGAR